MKYRLPLYVFGLLLSVVLGVTIGCSKIQPGSASTPDGPGGDSQITSAIQSKLYADPVIQSKQISVDTANGVVTLAGTVASEGERAQASAEAATIPGVKTVVNNITVSNTQAMATSAPVAAPVPVAKPRASQPVSRQHEPRSHNSSNDSYNDAPVAKSAPVPPPAPVAAAPAAPVVPPPPPPPAKVTVEAGTSLAVRLVDSLDSETAQQGQTFKATLDSPLAVDGEVVIPEGYDVQGHVTEVQSAGKFEGRSVLALQLDRIQVGSKHYAITTAPLSLIHISEPTRPY